MAAQPCTAAFHSGAGTAAATALERARQSVNRALKTGTCGASHPAPQLPQRTPVRPGRTALCSPFSRLIL